MWARWSRGVSDLISDALVEIHTRKARAAMMIVAVGLSTGALVASVGISTTAARQIDADIAASTIDTLTVSVASAYQEMSGEGAGSAGASVGDLGGPVVRGSFPRDAEQRARSIDLVADAGMRMDLNAQMPIVASREPVANSNTDLGVDVTVAGMSPGYPGAAEVSGPGERAWMLDSELPVAMLGKAAAAALDVPLTADPTGLTIWINDLEYSVIGFFGQSDDGSPGFSDVVAIPFPRAVEMAGGDEQAQLLVRAVPGAGVNVAEVIRTAIRPDAPERLVASQVVGVDSLRQGVSSQMGMLAGWIGTILMTLTVLLIANSMVVSVTARTGEIGLRRALGSSRSAVGAVFLAEGGVIGLLGGLAGAAVGVLSVVVGAVASNWTVVLSPWWLAAAPTLGAFVGLASSLYPSIRAARINPALALRSD